MKVPFEFLFKENKDGSFKCKHPVKLTGDTVCTVGFKFNKSSLEQYKGHDLEVEALGKDGQENYFIKGAYEKE